jgi:hypothetical protein
MGKLHAAPLAKRCSTKNTRLHRKNAACGSDSTPEANVSSKPTIIDRQRALGWSTFSLGATAFYALFALWNAANSTFLFDQAEHFLGALDLVTLRDWTPLGPNVSGTENTYLPGFA